MLPQIGQRLLENRGPLWTPPITRGACRWTHGQRPDPLAGMRHEPTLEREVAAEAVQEDNSPVPSVSSRERSITRMVSFFLNVGRDSIVARVSSLRCQTQCAVNKGFWHRLNNALQRICAYQTPNSFGGEGSPCHRIQLRLHLRAHAYGRGARGLRPAGGRALQ